MAEHKLFVKQFPSRRVKIVCFYHIEHVYLAYTYTLACHVLIETVEIIFKNKSVIYSDFTFYICYILSFFFFKWKQPMGIVKNIQLILYIIIFNIIMLYYITLCNNTNMCTHVFPLFPVFIYLWIYFTETTFRGNKNNIHIYIYIHHPGVCCTLVVGEEIPPSM